MWHGLKVTANNEIKVVYCAFHYIISLKKKISTEEFEYRHKNNSSKCSSQTGIWREEDR